MVEQVLGPMSLRHDDRAEEVAEPDWEPNGSGNVVAEEGGKAQWGSPVPPGYLPNYPD